MPGDLARSQNRTANTCSCPHIAENLEMWSGDAPNAIRACRCLDVAREDSPDNRNSSTSSRKAGEHSASPMRDDHAGMMVA